MSDNEFEWLTPAYFIAERTAEVTEVFGRVKLKVVNRSRGKLRMALVFTDRDLADDYLESLSAADQLRIV